MDYSNNLEKSLHKLTIILNEHCYTSTNLYIYKSIYLQIYN